MIRIDCIQGDPVWTDVRLGIATASNFDKIITNGGKKSGQWEKYARELLVEITLGVPVDGASSGFMQRGVTLERKARAFYELERDVDVELVGFVLRDDRRSGCSPDGLVETNGLLEIKCPAAATHIGYLLDGGIDYKAQVQGQLWVCEREWCDTVSHHPDLPDALVRTPRDEVFIAALATYVDHFCEYVNEEKRKLIAKGVLPDEEFPSLRIA